MIKTNAILFATLFAFYIGQNVENKNYVRKQAIDPAIVDGPYVLYGNDSVFVNYIEDNSGAKTVKTDGSPTAMKDNITLQVSTDMPGKIFNVQLKQKLSDEKSEYKGIKKMLVISDIEGNFEALRKLLQGNKVIDENFNWTYGKGHLVLTGDFVDRGNMVTEVLWLIYSLEEKAKAAEGYVHFILGNHEIMNMSGELDYVHGLYIEHAALMNRHYMHLFGPDSEIGRWLATKNIVERIGNILFTHGGISSYVNFLQLPVKEINDLSRRYYTDSTFKYPDKQVELLFSDAGPFWYRGYYKGQPKAMMSQIDSTLDFYNVRYISTGHTMMANQIFTMFDGKVINTDVHHAGGNSEALLVENGKFFRVNSTGEKHPIKSL